MNKTDILVGIFMLMVVLLGPVVTISIISAQEDIKQCDIQYSGCDVYICKFQKTGSNAFGKSSYKDQYDACKILEDEQ